MLLVLKGRELISACPGSLIAISYVSLEPLPVKQVMLLLPSPDSRGDEQDLNLGPNFRIRLAKNVEKKMRAYARASEASVSEL